MSAELGKIERPPVDDFKKGRKLFFIPLIYWNKELPSDYLKIFNKYWKQVKEQIRDLELKLGQISKVYHELLPSAGEDGIKTLKELSDKSYQIIKNYVDKGSHLEVIEDTEVLTEFMDWSRCLTIGIQNQKVLEKIYQFYTEVSKNRDELMKKRIDETLEVDKIGVLFLREGHNVTFPSDIEVFYISPPALDEIKRWLRNQEIRHTQTDEDKEKSA